MIFGLGYDFNSFLMQQLS